MMASSIGEATYFPSTYSVDENNFFLIRTNSAGDFVPQDDESAGDLVSYSRVDANGDGNCLFQSVASCVSNKQCVAPNKIRAMRLKMCSAMANHLESSASASEQAQFNDAVGSEYFPSLSGEKTCKRWYVCPKKIQKNVRRYAKKLDDESLRLFGEPVHNSVAYYNYLTIAGHQKDAYFALCLSYGANNELFDVTVQDTAVYADEFIMKYIAQYFRQTLWICKVTDIEAKTTLLIKYECLNPIGKGKRIHLVLKGEHYEWLQRTNKGRPPSVLLFLALAWCNKNSSPYRFKTDVEVKEGKHCEVEEAKSP
jgi:hypothetical protein